MPGLAFRKTIVAFACAILATYGFVLPDLPANPSFMELAQRVMELGLLGAAALGVPVFMLWAASDAFGKKFEPGEAFKVYATVLMGFLLFETLRRLASVPTTEAEPIPTAYLTTLAQVLVGILIAFAAESLRTRESKAEVPAQSP